MNTVFQPQFKCLNDNAVGLHCKPVAKNVLVIPYQLKIRINSIDINTHGNIDLRVAVYLYAQQLVIILSLFRSDMDTLRSITDARTREVLGVYILILLFIVNGLTL